MLKTSEWVSLGHPDKVADYISCYILDRFLEKDPAVRYALEVQIKDEYVSLGGEITSSTKFSETEIAKFVRDAVDEIGYTREYQKRWGKENTICGDDLIVTQNIGCQSPDIAQGVDAGGWGDQGIFWGMATNTPATGYMPKDWWLAKQIGSALYNIRYAGLDIKTQVTLDGDRVDEVVVAIPMLQKHSKQDIANLVSYHCGADGYSTLHVNGTGKFVKHGPVGDCGTTGRKLAVDFYGGNCRIGGGSPWTKDGSKADLSLNLMARLCALEAVKEYQLSEVHCAISCRIGSPEVTITLLDASMQEIKSYRRELLPSSLIKHLHLNEPRFCDMCKNGLFVCF